MSCLTSLGVTLVMLFVVVVVVDDDDDDDGKTSLQCSILYLR